MEVEVVPKEDTAAAAAEEVEAGGHTAVSNRPAGITMGFHQPSDERGARGGDAVVVETGVLVVTVFERALPPGRHEVEATAADAHAHPVVVELSTAVPLES